MSEGAALCTVAGMPCSRPWLRREGPSPFDRQVRSSSGYAAGSAPEGAMILQGTRYSGYCRWEEDDISHSTRSGGLPSTVEGVMLAAFHDSPTSIHS